MEEIKMTQSPNISMGIQMAPKKEKLVDPLVELIEVLKHGDNSVFDKEAY